MFGPVADDNTMETVQLYLSGVLTADEAVNRFYDSQTYEILRETENGLWAESAEYIADRYFEEAGISVSF